MDRDEKFSRIKKVYEREEREILERGNNLFWNTDKGIFGTSSMDACYKFFCEIGLEKYKHFLDLGSGDGRIVMVASLFTKATGIEFDKKLVDKARRVKEESGLDCELIKGDYMQHDISGYDIIFINPDKGFIWGLDNKFSQELKGELYVFNEIFKPSVLEKGQKYWFWTMPIVKYTNPETSTSE